MSSRNRIRLLFILSLLIVIALIGVMSTMITVRVNPDWTDAFFQESPPQAAQADTIEAMAPVQPDTSGIVPPPQPPL